MFGNAFKNASRFFGTHFTQMNPNTILRLSPTQSFNFSLLRVEKLQQNLDLRSTLSLTLGARPEFTIAQQEALDTLAE